MWRVVAVLALLASSARADEWVTPTAHTLTSPDQKRQLVITPGGSGKTAMATAGGRSFKLAAPWMPVDAVLFDDGSLLTLDDWHQLGYGKIATCYERDGTIRWSKTLAELAGQPFVDSAPHSVSSIWWRKTPLEWSLAKDGKSGLITLFDENQLQLVLRDGTARMVAVANLPEDPQRLLNRARAMVNQSGKEIAAIALLERAIAKDPDLLEAVLLYAQTLQRANDHARVVAGLERMSTKWTSKDGYGLANVEVAWAVSLVALSRPTDAERVLRLAVAAAPAYPNPVVALAKLLVDQSRRKDADVVVDDFVGRLFKSPNLDTYALADVAELYKTQGELAKALALYLRAYKKDQVTNQFLYANLALLYEKMGKLADAIRIDEQLLAYFLKMGPAFASYVTSTRDELTRLRAKP